jgi:hypothetical protein
VLAVLGSFCTVSELRIDLPLSSGQVTPLVFRYDAWGRMTTTSKSSLNLGAIDIPGARFGILLCGCAALLLAAALTHVRSIDQGNRRALAAAAGVYGSGALAGVTACLFVSLMPQSHSANDAGTVFRFGPAGYLAVAASIIGLCGSAVNVALRRAAQDLAVPSDEDPVVEGGQDVDDPHPE